MALTDEKTWLTQLSESPKARFWKLGHDELSEPERVFVCVWEFEAAVEDGGFMQYFASTAPEPAAEIAHALMLIRAPLTSDLAARAIAILGDEILELDAEDREDRLDRLSAGKQKKLDKLTEELLERPEDLMKLLHAYVKTHAKKIPGAE